MTPVSSESLEKSEESTTYQMISQIVSRMNECVEDEPPSAGEASVNQRLFRQLYTVGEVSCEQLVLLDAIQEAQQRAVERLNSEMES